MNVNFRKIYYYSILVTCVLEDLRGKSYLYKFLNLSGGNERIQRNKLLSTYIDIDVVWEQFLLNTYLIKYDTIFCLFWYKHF